MIALSISASSTCLCLFWHMDTFPYFSFTDTPQSLTLYWGVSTCLVCVTMNRSSVTSIESEPNINHATPAIHSLLSLSTHSHLFWLTFYRMRKTILVQSQIMFSGWVENESIINIKASLILHVRTQMPTPHSSMHWNVSPLHEVRHNCRNCQVLISSCSQEIIQTCLPNYLKSNQ